MKGRRYSRGKGPAGASVALKGDRDATLIDPTDAEVKSGMAPIIKTLQTGFLFLLLALGVSTLGISQAALAEAEGGEGGESKAAGKSEYLEMKPSFIANYGGPGPIHFLKVDIALRLDKGEKTGVTVEHHMPYLRHALVMLLSRQTDETISTMEGKEKIRADALAAVQKILQDEEGAPLVQDLLFTNFVVQR